MAQILFTLLKSELKKLQGFADLLSSANGPGNDLSGISLEKLKVQITLEAERLTEVMTRAIFSLEKEKVVERYVQYHQKGIIDLADQLLPHFASYEGLPNAGQVRPVIQHFISTLFKLLNFIERYFSKYFSLDEKIPDSYRQLSSGELSAPITAVLNLAEARTGSAALVSCLYSYLAPFCTLSYPEKLNYRSLIYLKGFTAELKQVLDLQEIKDWELKIWKTLIYLNFNHLAFLTYYQDKISLELQDAGSDEHVVHTLQYYLSLVKSLQTKPGFSYDPAWPSVKIMMETWLTDQIAMCGIPSSAPFGTAPKTNESSEKMSLNVSVAHLACLIRLLFEENFFTTASLTDILKFISKHYRSKRQEYISQGSLSKEYYSINQVTAAMVRDLLHRMIASINKNHFPVWLAICVTGFGWSVA